MILAIFDSLRHRHSNEIKGLMFHDTGLVLAGVVLRAFGQQRLATAVPGSIDMPEVGFVARGAAVAKLSFDFINTQDRFSIL